MAWAFSKVETGVEGVRVHLFQGGDRSGGSPGHLVAGVKAGEVPRRIRAQLVPDEGGHVPQLLLGVVLLRDNQCGGLQPPPHPLDPLHVLQHRIQAGTAELVVEALGKGLEVHVDGIDQGSQLIQALRAHETVADHHVGQVLFLGQLGAVAHKLEKDRGLVVGVGDVLAVVLLRSLHELLRGHGFARDGSAGFGGLGKGIVLAEDTEEVAAHSTQGEAVAAGLEVV